MSGSAAGTTRPQGRTTLSDVRMVQANIKTGMPVASFQADVGKVLAQQPDFITYNEVMFRNDAVMAPGSYDIYRSTRNRYLAETAVAWNTAKWTEIDHGTKWLSDWRGVPPHKQVELGRRAANWVTLRGTDGRVVSVISVHIAPPTRGMPDLLRSSVSRLGTLVERLAPRGPVLVGGDFNVHYRSGRYPRDLLTAAGLVPTYDTMGAYFPTGDHFGMTIDYVFDRGTDTLRADEQYPVELNSDHDAVVAGFTWQTDLPSQTRVVANNPAGDSASRRAALAAVVAGVRAAQPGSLLTMATTRLALPKLTRQLKRAVDRGVRVHVVIAGDTPTAYENGLAARMAAYGDSHNWLRRCVSTCLTTYDASGVPGGFLMVRTPAGQWTHRYDASRRFGTELVQDRSRVRISTGEVALRDGVALFDGIG
jgi:endonuclease/exonuclease/phosphatase family metal-dependent hydrolase